MRLMAAVLTAATARRLGGIRFPGHGMVGIVVVTSVSAVLTAAAARAALGRRLWAR
jgi:hypothetical protein